MRSLLIFLSAFTIITSASAQYGDWKKVAVPEKAGSKYTFVDFADSLHGLLCSADGYFTLTSDGGRSWTPLQKAASTGTVFKVKMADSGTVLLAVNPDGQGNTKVYKITHAGTMEDSLLLPVFLDQSKYYGKGTISILNPHLIGFVTLDTSQYFISTKNFGSSWDTVSFDREFRRAKLLAIEALDSLHCFIGASAAGVGLGAGGYLYKSDDGLKTIQEMPTISFETVGMKVFTNEFACFGMTHSFDMTPSLSDILLCNSVTKQSILFSGGGRVMFTDMGALFRDGSNFSVPTTTHMSYQGNGIYQISGSTAAGDSLKFSAMAIGARKSYWYLTQEGQLFSNADNPTSVESGTPQRLPEDFAINVRIFPTPFNNQTTISLDLSHSLTNATIKIYDILGRLQRSLYQGMLASGTHRFYWDGKNDMNGEVGSGTYFTVVQSGMTLKLQKTIFLK
jgi:hypothetical protein